MINKTATAIALLVAFLLCTSFPVLADDLQDASNLRKIESARLLKEKAAAGTNYSNTSGESSFSVLKLFQGFALCVAAFLVGVHFYKKFVLKNKPDLPRRIKVLERIPLSSKSQLCLVQYNERRVLVAVGSESVSFYHDSDILSDLPGESADFTSSKELCSPNVN